MPTKRPSTSPRQEFANALGRGRFMLQRSASSGQYLFYPRLAEPGSGEQELNWVEASGEGVVHATTTIYPRPPATPHNVAIITLAEGPRIMSRVEHIDPDKVTIGMAVRAEIGQDENGPILLFRPSDDIL